MSRRGTTYSALGVGVVFGFFLTGSGLGDYHTIHDGLLLRDPYIYLMMAATVATAAVGLALLRRFGRTAFGGPLLVSRRPVRRPAVYGGAVFGVGLGVGATCPGITVSAIATGSWWGGVVLLGILAGLWLRGQIERRLVVSPPAGSGSGALASTVGVVGRETSTPEVFHPPSGNQGLSMRLPPP